MVLPAMPTKKVTNSPIDADAVRKLYQRDTTKGVRNRRLLKCTIPVGVYNAFNRMLEESGGAIAKGNGIGSPMVAVALKMAMASMIQYRVNDAVDDIRTIIPTEDGRDMVAFNMRNIAQRIEQK